MSSFGEADKASRVKSGKSEKSEWKVLATLGEIQKNKADTLKITRVNYAGKELVNLQIWRKNSETGKVFPLKDQKLSFNIELKDKVAEAISAAE